MKYKAFISYRHSDFSRPHAEALESALKRYAKPLLKQPLSIFRDERVLRPGDDLPSEIKNGLEQSEFLIYLATAEAARSKWIADELRTWCGELGRRDKLIIVHLNDKIEADAETGKIIWEMTDALPQLLEPYVDGIPVWEDLTWATSPEQRDLLNNGYQKAVNALVARFRDIDPGEMNDEEVLTHRRNLQTRNIAMGVMSALGVLAVIGWYLASENSSQLARSLSESDFREAAVELRDGRQQEAYALLARAIRNDEENQAASDRLIHLLNTRELPVAVKIGGPEEGAWTQLHASPDGRYALGLSSDGVLRIWSEDNMEAWRPSTAVIKDVKVGGAVALAQTVEGGLLWVDLKARKVSEFTSEISQVTSFDLNDSGTHVALSGGNSLCVGRFATPFTCDLRRDGDWKIGRNALASDGTEIIATSQDAVQVLANLSSAADMRTLKEQNEQLGAVAFAVIGPNDTVCAIEIDPGGLQEESWSAIDCLEDGYRRAFNARFDSARVLQVDSSDEGNFVVAAVDNDEVHVLMFENVSYHIDISGLKEARVFADGHAFYTVSSNSEVRFFASKSGRELGLPLQLDQGQESQIVPFGKGIFVLKADGTSYHWQTQLLDGASNLRLAGPLPRWYDAPEASSTGVTMLAGDNPGDWILDREGAASIVIRHPLPMEEWEAEQMAEAIGIWPQTIAAHAVGAPVIVTAAGNDELIVWASGTGAEIRRISSAGDHLFATSVFVDPRGKKVLIAYSNEFRTDRYCFGTGIVEYAIVDLTQPILPTASSALPVGWTILDATVGLSEILTVHSTDIRIVDGLTGNNRLAISADAPIIRATFGSQGRFIAAATRTGEIYVWDANTGLPIADRLVFDPEPLIHNGAPCDDDYYGTHGPLEFSPDSRFLGFRASLYADSVSDPKSSPLRWLIGNPQKEQSALGLARIAEAIAGARFNENGVLDYILQPDLESIQQMILNESAYLQKQLPDWISKSN